VKIKKAKTEKKKKQLTVREKGGKSVTTTRRFGDHEGGNGAKRGDEHGPFTKQKKKGAGGRTETRK